MNNEYNDYEHATLDDLKAPLEVITEQLEEIKDTIKFGGTAFAVLIIIVAYHFW